MFGWDGGKGEVPIFGGHSESDGRDHDEVDSS